MAGRVSAVACRRYSIPRSAACFRRRSPSNIPTSSPSGKAALAAVDAGCFARACLALAALDLTANGGRKSAIPARPLAGALDQTTPPRWRASWRGRFRARYQEIPWLGIADFGAVG